MYDIINISEYTQEAYEQLGTKRKFWFRDAHDKKNLFKEGRPGTGENWAEKIAAELCELLQLPHAKYDLATWDETQGVITPTIVPDGGRLVLGNELLSHFVTRYDAKKKYKQQQHTLRRALALIKHPKILLPLGFQSNGLLESALDIFIGYLMFDTWIANQDRHHENWGIIVTPESNVHLAPTFDHASGFGRNETDVTRLDRLTTKDKRRNMETYISKALSPFYSDVDIGKDLTTINAFSKAAALSPRAARAWLDRLGDIDETKMSAAFDELPKGYASEIAVSFAQKILELNKRRLLDLSVGLVK